MVCFLFLYNSLTGKENIFSIPKKEKYFGLLAGIFYLGASFFMLESYKYLPASIGFSVIQLNSIWTLLAGILIFKEIDFKRFSSQIILSLVFVGFGIFFLAISKS